MLTDGLRTPGGDLLCSLSFYIAIYYALHRKTLVTHRRFQVVSSSKKKKKKKMKILPSNALFGKFRFLRK